MTKKTDELMEELRDALAPELLLIERLGKGGMGEVFLARDPALKRNVAVKVLAPGLGVHASARERFAREAESAAAVAHPNVVPIHRIGHLPRSELGFIVMAHIDGPSLRDVVPEGRVASESDVRRIMAEVAGALAAAHARGVVHRDIKPANVLYDRLGRRFVVVDFGIAAVLNREGADTASRLTMEGYPVGTPAYMSPEQVSGDPVSAKSDVYSLGCMVYEMLTGRPPVSGPNQVAIARAHLHQQVAPVTSLRSDISPELANLVMRCLQKDADLRPSAEEVMRALGAVRRTAIEWPPPGLESLQGQGAAWVRSVGKLALAMLAFVLVMGIHPAAARPCCADSPDHSPGWLLLKRLSLVTPIHFDDADALSIWYFLLDASFFVALAAMVAFAVSTARVWRRMLAGRKSGYPMPVLARVAWDRHRDTPDLINLTGRYALVPVDRQARLIKRRMLGATLRASAFVLLLVSCLAWLGGMLEFTSDPSAELLPLTELLVVVVPAAALWIAAFVVRAMEVRHWRSWRRQPRASPLRRDVLDAWLEAAGVSPKDQMRGQLAVRAGGVAVVLVGMLAVAVAAYGLIAVFGASARYAGDRAVAQTWLAAYENPAIPDSALPRLRPTVALGLTAGIPLDKRVERVLTGVRLVPDDRRVLIEAIEPAFCLNPREILFGLTKAREAERDRVAGLAALGITRVETTFDPTPFAGGGVTGLRRRARFCEKYFADQATISPAFRPTS